MGRAAFGKEHSSVAASGELSDFKHVVVPEDGEAAAADRVESPTEAKAEAHSAARPQSALGSKGGHTPTL